MNTSKVLRLVRVSIGIPVVATMTHSHRKTGSVGANLTDSQWYSKQVSYWDEQSPDPDGMLGSYGFLSPIDVQTSSKFLESVMGPQEDGQARRVLDCGSGVGRVTQELLSKYFQEIDLVDQSRVQVDQSKIILHQDTRCQHKVRNFYVSGLQDFEYEREYSCVWVQWVIGYLTDQHLVGFLQRSGESLEQHGLIVIKDNVSHDRLHLDSQDNSVIRHKSHLLRIFELAGLEVVREEVQQGFPSELHPVYMYALRKKESSA